MPRDLTLTFTVGPSALYHGVVDFLCGELQNGLGSLSHRSPQFSEISEGTITGLRRFFQIPDEYRIYYVSSATEGMEIITRSAVTDKACHIVNGNFGDVWAKTSRKALKHMQKITHDDGRTRVELDEIVPEPDTELLALTANETATGIAYTPHEIAAIRRRFPHLLIAVDVTSAMGAVAYDFTDADAWFFSVQKAFGLPAGLGILIVGPRIMAKALAREQNGADVGCHHCLSSLEKKMAGKSQTPTTPNVMNIAALGFVCRKLQEDFGSVEKLYDATRRKAERFYGFFETHSKYRPAILSGRSESVIVVDGKPDDLAELHERLKQSGIVVGKGYGEAKTTQLRIANFPVHTMTDIENLLGKIGE